MSFKTGRWERSFTSGGISFQIFKGLQEKLCIQCTGIISNNGWFIQILSSRLWAKVCHTYKKSCSFNLAKKNVQNLRGR